MKRVFPENIFFRFLLPAAVLSAALSGCGIESVLEPDYLHPVYDLKAYPGSRSIIITFTSINTELKFDGFNIYLSEQSSIAGRGVQPLKNNQMEPTLFRTRTDIARDPVVFHTIRYEPDETRLENGKTYYICVRAHNYDGYLSEFCNETSTTPRLESSGSIPLSAGNGYSLPNGAAFQLVQSTNGLSLRSPLSGVKDEGWYPDIRLYNRVTDTEGGFSSPGTDIRLIEGHVLILKTPDNKFGKIYIDSVIGNAIEFRWASQDLQGSPYI